MARKSLGNFILKATKRYFRGKQQQQRKNNVQYNKKKSGYLPPWIDAEHNSPDLNRVYRKYTNYIRNTPYSEYLKSSHWKKTRERCLEQYKYKCSKCGSKDRLEVHHLNYAYKGMEQIGIDIIPLCNKCHKIAHNKRT